MGEFDAAGEIVTGGLIARAIEPGTDAGGAHGDVCLNCGTALIGPHCHRCGQEAHVHRTIGEIWHEILHGVVHFDGKLWRTLPLLAFRPGELTRRYIAGERKRFVSPMALFLFSLFTMFAVFQVAGLSPPADFGAAQAEFQQGFEEGFSKESAELLRQRTELEADRDALSEGDPQRAALSREITALETRLAERRTHLSGELAQEEVHTGWSRLDKGIKKAVKNPSLALYKLQSNSYKFSWLLIPLSLPFVWLMFAWKRGYGGYDHSVFITYSIAFMSLLFIAVTVLASLGVPNAVTALIATLVPPVHLYKHLKGAYQLRRLTAVPRALLLMVFVFIVLSLFLVILLLLGLLG
ncbi:DUF3667 domain-containing protein [Sphingosinithalassobacter sp. LHW66-3]|uniref:DUF3667 domain-containing protein n=1 Tax=Sphingosinithalassobacter sp. LHW66-3 TaxID=3424718 RepID=UPI003D6A415E